ncbi:MAG: pilin [Candidatus Nomurabacteria bacterium]|nr:pilin [Candidatus Nomurabacteria bacterium]
MFIHLAEAADTLTQITCGAGITNLTNLINFFTCTLMNAVVPLLGALAVVGFIYGIIKYFLNPDNEEKRKEGKNFMFWGLVTLFVMVSIWGIVSLFSNSFLGNEGKPLFLPTLPETKL